MPACASCSRPRPAPPTKICRSQLAILVSYTVTGIVFGILVALNHRHGHYGMHWLITFTWTASGLPVPHIALGM